MINIEIKIGNLDIAKTNVYSPSSENSE